MFEVYTKKPKMVTKPTKVDLSGFSLASNSDVPKRYIPTPDYPVERTEIGEITL